MHVLNEILNGQLIVAVTLLIAGIAAYFMRHW